MKVIVGLGNPGREYENTRHNAGFKTLDKLAGKYNISLIEYKHKSLCGKGMIGSEKVLLVKPQTYMNCSGEAVRAVMDFYKIGAEDFIIIYDDIDLEPGQLRIREKGTAGSHNGMKSVVAHMGTTAFARIRVGVGAKPADWDLADYVLGRPDGADARAMDEAMVHAVEAIEMMVAGDRAGAMNKFNQKEKKPENQTAEKAEEKAGFAGEK